MYFKTKNFASFVRQLNMYGFHKIKNDKGVHEFKHPQFKKDHYEELAHIKRKNILSDKGEDQDEKEFDTDEFNHLREKLEFTKNSVENVTQQNTNLISANKDVAGQLYNFKQEYENRLSKFFFMFYFIINSRNEGILTLLKKTLMDLGINYEDNLNKTVEQRTLEASEYITTQIAANENCEHTIMNKLLNAFTFYINVGDNSLDDLYIPEDLINKVNEKIDLDESEYDFRSCNQVYFDSDSIDNKVESKNIDCKNYANSLINNNYKSSMIQKEKSNLKEADNSDEYYITEH